MFHGSIIPARFLTLLAHLTITITIFWSKDVNIESCLPTTYTEAEYKQKDIEMIVGLSLMLCFIALELFIFLGGISMFSSSISMFSIAAHGGAAITLSVYLLEAWDCDKFWYIFGVCSALPAVLEIGILIGVMGLKIRV